jgi:hypothetical protein
MSATSSRCDFIDVALTISGYIETGKVGMYGSSNGYLSAEQSASAVTTANPC